MSDLAVHGDRVAWRGKLGTEIVPAAEPPDARRALQLGLAGVWLLDALLQYQPVMFTRAFGQMLAETAAGNPGVIARPISWDAALVEHHAVALNAVFATIQLLLGLGIALRPLTRFALAASVAWSLAVWWLGEGLGGVLNGTANPVSGAPGAVILYALLAVLLWPADRGGPPAMPRRRSPLPGRSACAPPAGTVAGAVAEPGLVRAPAGEPGPAGAARPARPPGERRAWLAGRHREQRGRGRRRPRPGHVDRAGRGLRARRRRGLPAPAGRPGDPAAGPRPCRGDLGGRAGARDDSRRGSDRPQLRAAARPDRAGLLAGEARARAEGAPP